MGVWGGRRWVPSGAEVNVFLKTLDRGVVGDYGTGFTDFGTEKWPHERSPSRTPVRRFRQSSNLPTLFEDCLNLLTGVRLGDLSWGHFSISRQGFDGGAIVLVISQSPDRGLVVKPLYW